jgi:hypothetical protein
MEIVNHAFNLLGGGWEAYPAGKAITATPLSALLNELSLMKE